MSGLIIFDPNDRNVGFSLGEDQAAGLYLDIESDALYFTDLNNIVQWEGDEANNKTYTWRSGRVRLARPVNIGAAVIEANSYNNITFKLFAVLDGALNLITQVTVYDNEPFRLPGGYTSNLYEIEIVGTDRVTSATFAQNIFELSAAG